MHIIKDDFLPKQLFTFSRYSNICTKICWKCASVTSPRLLFNVGKKPEI